MKGSEAQKQRPQELLWMLWFGEKNISNILQSIFQFQAHLRWTYNALPLRPKAYLCLGIPLLGKIGTESYKNTASFIDLWCFGKVGNQKNHQKKNCTRVNGKSILTIYTDCRGKKENIAELNYHRWTMQIDKHFLCYRKSWSPGSSYSWWQGHLKWPGLLSKLFHSSGSLDKGWRWPQKSVNLLSHQGRLWVVFYNITVFYSSIRICVLTFACFRLRL